MIFDHLEAFPREMDAICREYLDVTPADDVTASNVDRCFLALLFQIGTLDGVGMSLKRIASLFGIDQDTAITLLKAYEALRNPDNALAFRQMVEAMERTEAFVKIKEATSNANH